MRILEQVEGLGRKVVVAARVRRWQSLSQARERECVVAHRADVMLRLPETTPLDACARVEGVDDAPAKQVVRDQRRGNEHVPWDGRCATPGIVRSGSAEQKPESWASRTELNRRRQRQVKLQC